MSISPDEIEWVRRCIEECMSDKYHDRSFDDPTLMDDVQKDLAVVQALFPELDITAMVLDDPPQRRWLRRRAHGKGKQISSS